MIDLETSTSWSIFWRNIGRWTVVDLKVAMIEMMQPDEKNLTSHSHIISEKLIV